MEDGSDAFMSRKETKDSSNHQGLEQSSPSHWKGPTPQTPGFQTPSKLHALPSPSVRYVSDFALSSFSSTPGLGLQRQQHRPLAPYPLLQHSQLCLLKMWHCCHRTSIDIGAGVTPGRLLTSLPVHSVTPVEFLSTFMSVSSPGRC